MPPAPWPADNPASLAAFYGKHDLRQDGFPTAAWEQQNLTTFLVPYPMVLSWAPRTALTRIRCHRLVAASLKDVLEGILAHYGSATAIRRAGMHLFGGVYSFRRISGVARLSTHAWGAGIDLDPDANPLGKPWKAGAGMMPKPVVALFEAAGWRWGGRFKNRPDCMHFQATS